MTRSQSHCCSLGDKPSSHGIKTLLPICQLLSSQLLLTWEVKKNENDMLLQLWCFDVFSRRPFQMTGSILYFICVFGCVYRVNELYVDDPDKDSGGKIDVSLNISLPNLHCDCEYIHKIHKYTFQCFSIHMHKIIQC